MTRSFSVRLGLAFAVALSLAPIGASAQSPQEIDIARQTAGEGLQAYKAGEYDKAVRLFEEAKAIYPSAQILRLYGYSLLAQDKWEAAADAMQAAMDSKVGPLSDKDKDDVKEQLAKATAHFAMVTITSKVEGSELTLDGKPAQKLPLDKPIRLLEGKHTFSVHAADRIDASQEVMVAGGKPLTLALDPADKDKPPPPPPKPLPPPPVVKESKGLFPHQREVGFAVAGAGVLLGGAALTVALAGAHIRSSVAGDVTAHNKAYPADCSGPNHYLCQYDILVVNHDADRADGLRNASVWMGIGAGVLGAGGIALILLAPSPKKEAGATPPVISRKASCRPAGAGIFCAGTF